jgi:hypothetical protein
MVPAMHAISAPTITPDKVQRVQLKIFAPQHLLQSCIITWMHTVLNRRRILRPSAISRGV